MSSAIIPYPLGSRSHSLMPSGLKMSKYRNRASDSGISHHGQTAVTGRSEIHCPTVSSTHADTGSGPQCFSASVLAHVPATVSITVATIVTASMTGVDVHR